MEGILVAEGEYTFGKEKSEDYVRRIRKSSIAGEHAGKKG